MQAFDLFLYALAIITVLLLRAETNPATVAATEPQPEPIEAPQPIEAKPEPQPIAAMAAAITEPVVSVNIPTEATPATEAPADLASILASMTSPELRKECQSAGIRWRNAHAKGKHLSKGEMVEAMIAALAK